MTKPIKYVFYEDRNGKSEIYDYVLKISQSNRPEEMQVFKKLTYQLELLQLLGERMREPQAKRLTHLKYPLWELRPMPERIFYAYWQDNQYIILHHYTKRQAKTDPQQVQHALRLLDDWISRKENEK